MPREHLSDQFALSRLNEKMKEEIEHMLDAETSEERYTRLVDLTSKLAEEGMEHFIHPLVSAYGIEKPISLRNRLPFPNEELPKGPNETL